MLHVDLPETGPAPSPAAEAGLRLLAHRLGASAVHLYTDGGQLVASVGEPGMALPVLAATLGDTLALLDVSAVVDGVHLAAGQRAGGVGLLALGLAAGAQTPAWQAAFADALALAQTLVESPAEGGGARLMHRVATHTGTFDERLSLGLDGLAEALGLEAAAFARIEDGVWTAEMAVDPHRILPPSPSPVADLPCAMTVCADGPLVADAPGDGIGTYIGAPVFAGGRTVGTLVALGRARRMTPFTTDERSLVESLARWVGSAIGGRDAARRLADREAALTAFVDRAPVAMGLTTLDGDGAVRIVSVNAAAARLFGASAAELSGATLDQAGVVGAVAHLWEDSTRRAITADPGTSLAPIALVLGAPDGPRTVEATLTRLDVHDAAGRLAPCVSFVAEDVTARDAGLRIAAERRHLAETTAAEQAGLFERLHRDVRTPLTTILGYADLLGAPLEDGEAEQIRDVVSRAAHHLLDTLDATVALAEAARVPIALVPVDAVGVVRSAIEAAGEAPRAAGVEVAFEATVSSAPLLMDPALVARIVRAVVDEAVARPGARAVEAHLSEAGARLVLDIRLRSDATDAPVPTSVDRLTERLVERLGGTVDMPSGTAWRRTVRLPRHAAVVVDLPPEALLPDALHFASSTLDLHPDADVPDGPVDGGSPFGSAADVAWTSAEHAA